MVPAPELLPKMVTFANILPPLIIALLNVPPFNVPIRLLSPIKLEEVKLPPDNVPYKELLPYNAVLLINPLLNVPT